MIIHDTSNFCIYFGDAHTPVPRATCILLQQVHGADGVVLTSMRDVRDVQSRIPTGDYLITSLTGVGIGVRTADCLPIVVYDATHHVVGIAHAGWRGSVAGVAVCMIERMQQECGTQVGDVQIFFGPSAKSCCYEVQPDFSTHFDDVMYRDRLFVRRGEQLFFDLPLFNRLQLEDIGIEKEAFCFDYNRCTICDTSFFSHRRQGTQAGRQVTIAILKVGLHR